MAELSERGVGSGTDGGRRSWGRWGRGKVGESARRRSGPHAANGRRAGTAAQLYAAGTRWAEGSLPGGGSTAEASSPSACLLFSHARTGSNPAATTPSVAMG